MTLLKDLATVFITKYGYTHREGYILINILNYYHEYEQVMMDEQGTVLYNAAYAMLHNGNYAR